MCVLVCVSVGDLAERGPHEVLVRHDTQEGEHRALKRQLLCRPCAHTPSVQKGGGDVQNHWWDGALKRELAARTSA